MVHDVMITDCLQTPSP